MTRQSLRAEIAVAAFFLCLGFQYATWTSRLPAIKDTLGLTTGQTGLLILASGAGAAVSFPLVTVLMRKLGSRSLAGVSAITVALCLIPIAQTPPYPVMLAILFVNGIGCACLDVAMNAQGALLEETYERTVMSRLHAVFSGGGLIGALAAAGVSSVTPNLTVNFGIAAAFIVVLVAYAWPRLSPGDLAGQTRSSEKVRRGFTLPTRLALLLGLAMAFATVVEGAMTDWSAVYLKDVAGASAELAPMGVAVFSGTMLVARLFADRWRSRWGDRQVVMVGCTLAAIGLSIGLVFGGIVPMLAGIACVGLGVAAAGPCVYVAAAKQGPDALTLVAATGITGMLAGPPVIGYLAEFSSLTWGMTAVAVAALLVVFCATRIPWPVAEKQDARS
ncbi:MFS transporter [Kibdelosporangium persicum]|uniref:Inner membrane protein YbjJ n=1 Tax=Kibdelosporangium persicum TaxID=2698649 RepID=A0ABX2F097_9PSEU|nr:MFS transporter [Kibdelosporangium persicum]NRN64714.1 Inner membrane protein YbjJ [Kibdelosporangium persicum]